MTTTTEGEIRNQVVLLRFFLLVGGILAHCVIAHDSRLTSPRLRAVAAYLENVECWKLGQPTFIGCRRITILQHQLRLDGKKLISKSNWNREQGEQWVAYVERLETSGQHRPKTRWRRERYRNDDVRTCWLNCDDWAIIIWEMYWFESLHKGKLCRASTFNVLCLAKFIGGGDWVNLIPGETWSHLILSESKTVVIHIVLCNTLQQFQSWKFIRW